LKLAGTRLAIGFAAVVSFACATRYPTTDVYFYTVPSEAVVTVGERGSMKCTTPCNVRIDRGPDPTPVTIEKAGYVTGTATVEQLYSHSASFNAAMNILLWDIGGGIRDAAQQNNYDAPHTVKAWMSEDALPEIRVYYQGEVPEDEPSDISASGDAEARDHRTNEMNRRRRKRR